MRIAGDASHGAMDRRMRLAVTVKEANSSAALSDTIQRRMQLNFRIIRRDHGKNDDSSPQ